MGYSGRYHAASLAAVFLALAVGILIGVGFGSDIVTGTADDLQQGLENDLEDARAQVDDLQGELEAERTFEAAIYPAVVEDQLRSREIALIGIGGLDQGIAGDVDAAIGPAGAEVTEVAVARNPPDLEALAQTVGERRAREVERGDPEAVQFAAERAGRALVEGGPRFDSLRGSVLSRYSGSPDGIDGVVVVRDPPEDLDPDEQQASDALQQGLVDGLADASITVGAETTGDDPSSIPFFDDRGIPTVDSVDLLSGRVALVYALTGAASGNFGVKDTADSLLPDLLTPDEQIAPGAGGGRG
ncbi:MAG: copper transporter [Solirubrobacterales bacterium]